MATLCNNTSSAQNSMYSGHYVPLCEYYGQQFFVTQYAMQHHMGTNKEANVKVSATASTIWCLLDGFHTHRSSLQSWATMLVIMPMLPLIIGVTLAKSIGLPLLSRTNVPTATTKLSYTRKYLALKYSCWFTLSKNTAAKEKYSSTIEAGKNTVRLFVG